MDISNYTINLGLSNWVNLIDYREAYLASPLTHYSLFIVYYASKIRSIFYLYRYRKINLRHVLKTQTKISLAIDFFILAKRKSTSMMHFLQSYAFQDT